MTLDYGNYMVYSLLWVMQDLHPEPFTLNSWCASIADSSEQKLAPMRTKRPRLACPSCESVNPKLPIDPLKEHLKEVPL